jgi:hypothetical protein
MQQLKPDIGFFSRYQIVEVSKTDPRDPLPRLKYGFDIGYAFEAEIPLNLGLSGRRERNSPLADYPSPIRNVRGRASKRRFFTARRRAQLLASTDGR